LAGGGGGAPVIAVVNVDDPCFPHLFDGVALNDMTLSVTDSSPVDPYSNPFGTYVGPLRRLPGEATIPDGKRRETPEPLRSPLTVDSDFLGNGMINPATGEIIVSAVDQHISSRGPDIVWKRIYRSRTGDDTAQGNGWDHSNNIYLEAYGGNLVVHDGGRKDFYFPTDPNTWVAVGFFRELTRETDGSFTMTFAHKGKWRFNPLDGANSEGKINAVTDRNGNAMTYSYDALGRLTTIHDALDSASHNRDINISYNAGGYIESVTDWIGRKVTYEYYSIGEAGGSVGDLKTATSPSVTGTPTENDFPEGKTTAYTYSKGYADERLNHNLMTINGPIGEPETYIKYKDFTIENEIGFDHVSRLIVGDANDRIDITYHRQVPDANNNYAVTKAVINDRAGHVSEYSFDHHNRLVTVRDYTGMADPNLPTTETVNRPTRKWRASDPDYFESRYQYNDNHLLTHIELPNGNSKEFTYDETNPDPHSRGNLIGLCSMPGPLGGEQEQICRAFEYDPNTNNDTNFVTRYTDPRGNEATYEYDARGNLTRTCRKEHPPDPCIEHNWEYNEFGQMTAHILPDNGSGSERLDGFRYYEVPGQPHDGHLKNIVVDANNLALTTTFEYDGVGNVTRIIDPNGHDTQYVYNQLNQLVRRISREVNEGSGVRYERDYHYDENDNLVRVDVQNVDEGGVVLPNSHITTSFEYDSRNRMWRIEQELDSAESVATEYGYDENDNVIEIRFGEGVNGNQPNNTVGIVYDERGLVFEQIRAPGDDSQSTNGYDYDGNGNLIRLRQGLEEIPHVTSFEYDGYGRLVKVNNAMGNVTEYVYDASGNQIKRVRSGERVDSVGDDDNTGLSELSYDYDALNRLIGSEISFFDPNTQLHIGDGNSITQYFYSDSSQLRRIVDDNGNETLYEYDTVNRLGMVTDAKGNTATYSYDENSNVIGTTQVDQSDIIGKPDETFVMSYSYDGLGRVMQVTDNAENTTDYAYDSHGNLTLRTDALGHERRYIYDGLRRLITTIVDMDEDGDVDGEDFIIWQEWDDSSRVITQTDPNGNTTAYEHDALNRLIRILLADGTEKTTTYDVHDNPIIKVDANGTIVDSTFDLLNRVTAKTISPAAGVSTDTTFENYKYDGLSRMVYAENDDSIVTFSYDSMSNVLVETLNGNTTTYEHDGMGNKLSVTYPGGRVLTFSHDELNRINAIMDGAGASSVVAYDYIGFRVERIERANDTRSDNTYDNLGRVIGTQHLYFPSTTILDQRSSSWDAVNNKIQRKDTRTGGPGLTHDYSYDDADRLINTIVTDLFGTVRDTDYALDRAGNRTAVSGDNCSGSYTMDATMPDPADKQMNQYTNVPCEISRSYDSNGNLTNINRSVGNSFVMSYDYRNRLVSYMDMASQVITTYKYDVLGRRIEKVVDSGASVETTRFLYDGLRLVEEQDELGITQGTYVTGPINDHVVMTRGGTDHYYHSDDMGNVMAVTDGTGAVVERYEYEDYGEPSFFDSSGKFIGGSAIGNEYLFSSLHYDSESGWYNLGPSYFDPVVGRFTTRDIIDMTVSAKIMASNKDSSTMQMDLQTNRQRQSQAMKTISSIMKSQHDILKAIINNMK
jgi:YD repeat-containing protein